MDDANGANEGSDGSDEFEGEFEGGDSEEVMSLEDDEDVAMFDVMMNEAGFMTHSAVPLAQPLDPLVTKEELCSATSREPLALALRVMCGGIAPAEFVQQVGGGECRCGRMMLLWEF